MVALITIFVLLYYLGEYSGQKGALYEFIT